MRFKAIPVIRPLALMRDQTMLPVAANDLTKSLEEPPEHYNPFPSIEDVRAFKATTFAFDIECPCYKTLGPDAPAEMVGLCSTATHALCVPIRGEYLGELKRIFRCAEAVIGHNCLQFDLPKLEDVGIKTTAKVWDTMLLQHLVCPDLPHDLEFVGSQFVSKPAWKDDKTEGWELYCCRDTDVTYQVWLELLPLVKKEKLLDLYFNVQVPLAKICYQMFKTGFKVNPGRIGEVRDKLLKEQAELELQLPESLRSYDRDIRKRIPAPPGTLGKAGKPVKYVLVPDKEHTVPWRSPAEKQRFLYSDDPGCLGMERVLDLKSGNVTTGKMAIAKLFGKTRNPAILALGKLNKIDETLSTFAKSEMVGISRMHPHFNVHGTASGRLSSSDPNLQNIPESVRCIYVPSHAGWKIVDCVTPETKVLTYDLRWVEAGNVKQGDVLVGFNENRGVRHFCKANVTNAGRAIKWCYKVTTDKGSIIASLDHSFLWKNPNNGRNYEWQHVSNLKIGDEIGFCFPIWETDHSFEAGWFSGILDEEGWTSCRGKHLGFGQNQGVVADAALTFAEANGLQVREYRKSKCRKFLFQSNSPFVSWQVAGKYRPLRLLPKIQKYIEGTKLWSKKSSSAKVLKIEFVNKQEVAAIETDCHTLITAGFFSHNCDYSNIENRLTAILAGDRERLRKYEDPKHSDYKVLVNRAYGIPYDEIIKDNSREAPYGKCKAIVLGINYGLGAKKISKMYDIPLPEVCRLLDVWKSEIKLTSLWQTKTAAEAKREGVLTTPFGRRRWFWTSSTYTESLSFLPQSCAADIIFRSMLGLMFERIGWPESKVRLVCPITKAIPTSCNLLLQVHDSLVFECGADKVDELVATLKLVMEQPWKELGGHRIPISVKVGDSWGD